jgi:hypothetical protein
LLAGIDAHVNVIPLNPTAGYDGAPADPSRVEAFLAALAAHPEFRAGRFDTGFIDAHAEALGALPRPPSDAMIAEAVVNCGAQHNFGSERSLVPYLRTHREQLRHAFSITLERWPAVGVPYVAQAAEALSLAPFA